MLALFLCAFATQEVALERLLPSASERPGALIETLVEVGETGDLAYVPPLVDLLAFATTREEWFGLLAALGALLGENLRETVRPWRTLRLRFGETAKGHASYPEFKRRLLSERVDPGYLALLAPAGPGAAAKSELVFERVDWGGVPINGIPALLDPPLAMAEEMGGLDPEEPVFGMVIGGEARAYPLRILDWHELVNDRLGGVAFALSYCTLCGAGVAYRTGDEEERDIFRTSGLLLDSNKLMFDERTHSLWRQIEGRAVHGERVGEPGLEVLAVELVSWATWLRRQPGTSVVSRKTGFERDYRTGAAYGAYFASPETMFPAPGVVELGARAKERVFVVRTPGGSAALAVEAVLEAGVLRGRAGEVSFVALATPAAAGGSGAAGSAVRIPEVWADRAPDLEALRGLSLEAVLAALAEDPERLEALTPELLLELPVAVRLPLLTKTKVGGEPFFAVEVRNTVALWGLRADVRAYVAPPFEIRWRGTALVDEAGRDIRIEDADLVDAAGRRWARVPSHLAFRFGWDGAR